MSTKLKTESSNSPKQNSNEKNKELLTSKRQLKPGQQILND